MQGKVKWFNDKKGYGFIINEEGKEVFVHYKDIIAEGYKSLKENATVTYDEEKGERGLVAKNVKLCE